MNDLHSQPHNTDTISKYVLGLDYGSDSVRALLLDAVSGEEISSRVSLYKRWATGEVRNPALEMARQHPSDYIESTIEVLREIVKDCDDPKAILGIALDSTASTPCLVDGHLSPLALTDKYKDNPDAMFVLWKDHTASEEASSIRRMIADGSFDYADGCGGFYSPECFWAKVAHVLNTTPSLENDAYVPVELCDWLAAILTGTTDPTKMKVNERLSAIKQMWSHERSSFPPAEFMAAIHRTLPKLANNVSSEMRGADSIAGYLSTEWASHTGLKAGIPVAVGNIDSYAGGVGAGIEEGTIVLNLGTSACFLAVVAPERLASKTIPGVFAMAHDSILPGYVGIETGLSAFGDVFAWFKNLIGYNRSEEEVDTLLASLTEDASKITPTLQSPIATDHLNGRRAPSPEPDLRGVISGLSLATSAPQVFYALVEATSFATRRVIDHLVENGVNINSVVAIGGISKKSPFVMQMLANVLRRPIAVAESAYACSRGSAIHAAVVAGIYPDVATAAAKLKSPATRVFIPDATRTSILDQRYMRYRESAEFAEKYI